MTGIGRGVTKEGPTYHIYIYILYLIRTVHSRLCGARSGSPQLYHCTIEMKLRVNEKIIIDNIDELR